MNENLDMDYIIKLAENQLGDMPNVIDALRKAKDGFWDGKAYYRFVDSRNANQPGAEWQFDGCIVLEQVDKGDLVIDLLKDGRIGGIEFIDFIEK